MAWLGTTTALVWVVSRRVTRTNWPGHNLWLVLGNVPFSLMVPVVISTVLSTKVRVPRSSSAVSASCGRERTLRLPRAMYFLMAGNWASGTEKVTYMGSTWLMVIMSILLAVTTLPCLTVRLPVRPSMGEYMVV